MVLEVRKIILSPEELTMALNSYRRKDPGFLPGGRILRCEICHDEEIAVELEQEMELVEIERNWRKAFEISRKVALLPSRVTEPLIHFCIDYSIMLPRRGRKSTILSQGLPILFVELETAPVVDFD